MFRTILLTIAILTFTVITAQAEESTWIIEVDEDPDKVKQYINDYYPLLEVEYVYETLMQALAVKGDLRHIEKLYDEQFIKSVDQVKTYSVPNAVKSKANINPEKAKYHPAKLRYTGKGVKVGVIDTGIDYSHPDLEKSYHGGFDVVDFDDDPMETKPEQGMPTLHGTHVAGIIAGNGTMEGVAPNADIYAYRALGPGGSGTTAQVIAALEQAVKDDMDLINMSLGSETNSPDDPMTKAVNRAIELGTMVIVANGNSGPEDWTVGSPATSNKAISVGAAITELKVAYIKTYDTHPIEVRQLPMSEPWQFKKDLPIVAVKSLENLKPSIHDRVVLVQKGDLPYYELIHKLKQKNVSAALIYNPKNDDPNTWHWVEAPFPLAYVTEEEAQQLMNGDKWLTTTYQTVKNSLAPFSSRGPVASSWLIKPDILAPGVDIVSTVPDGYASLQGTSMAAPYVTGVMALLKEAYPHDTPEQLKDRLLSTANPFSKQNQEMSPTEQGAGFVDPDHALKTPYTISDQAINFGKINASLTHQQVEHSFTVTNHSRDSLSVQWNMPKRQPGIIWVLPLSTSIPAQTKKTFTIRASIKPYFLNNGQVEGFLEMNLNGEKRHLPYLFINKTDDYPRITGLELNMEPFQNEELTLRFLVNEPIDQLTVTLVDPKYLTTTPLFKTSSIEEGPFEKVFKLDQLPEGQFKIIFEMTQNEERIIEEMEVNFP